MVWQTIAQAAPTLLQGMGSSGGGLLSGLGSSGGGSLFSLGDGGGLSMGADFGLGMNAGYDPMTSITGGLQSAVGGGGLEPPEPPTPPRGPGPDMSGFAAAGLESPELWDMGTPESQLASVMSLATAGDPHAASKEDPFQKPRQGGLMSYLETLGAV